jgi:hypothetical protein
LTFNIEDTWAAKSIAEWQKAANKVDVEALKEDRLPNDAWGQLKRLRQVDSIGVNKEVIVKAIFIQNVNARDKNNKPIKKHYLTWTGELLVKNKRQVPYSQEFLIGKYDKPRIVVNDSQQWNPKTGEPLFQEEIMSGKDIIWTIEVTEKNIKKTIDDILGDQHPDSIQWYYVEMQDNNTRHHRDNTFTYEDFTTKSFSEIRNMSHRGGGSKTPGYYRDAKDGKLHNKDGSLFQG